MKNFEVDSLEGLMINGVKQWVYIRSKNKNNPVLLFLHGGPGFPGIAAAQAYQSELENKFTVVQWDQRGAGKSYSPAIPKESMNINQLLSDLHELVSYLNNSFGCQKIYLMGHSWGAMLGMLAVKKHPELFHCFISVGQSVNCDMAHKSRYNFYMQQVKESNDLIKIQEVEYTKRNSMLSYEYVVKSGGAFFRKTDTNRLVHIFFDINTLYTDAEKQAIPVGMDFSCSLLWEEIDKINLMKTVLEVDVPVMFISGKYDMLCPTEVTEKYYRVIKAPDKKLIIMENSAHFPFLEETEQFCDVINGVDKYFNI